jgi:hypothetical protein
MADQSCVVKDGGLMMIIFWIVFGLINGLAIAVPTCRLDTTCISLQTGLLINVLACLIGMAGTQWLALPLLIIGIAVCLYALLTCASPFNNEVRR